MIEKKMSFRRISDYAVRARTDKGWEEWFTISDVYSEKEKGHTKGAKHLSEN